MTVSGSMIFAPPLCAGWCTRAL